MKRILPFFVALFLLSGCAAYKELSPDPAIIPLERGYIPLKDGDENFTLDKDKKYYMEVPGPGKNQFYLVLTTDKRWALDPLLTRVFDDKEGPGERITDEASGNDSLMVYPVDASATRYFWVVESVRADVELTLRYRYVPRWRFTFETKSAQYRQTLERNLADRTTFNAIDERFSFSGFNFKGERSTLDKKTASIVTLSDELKKLEDLFPPEIRGSQDTAYQHFVQLKSDVTDELDFQKAYASVLATFQRLEESQGRTGAFLEGAPVFLDFLRSKQIPPRAIDRGRRDIAARLPEAYPYYDNQLRTKRDITKITLTPPVEPLRPLHEACGVLYPSEFVTLKAFVDRFNVEAGAVQNAGATLKRLERLPESGARFLSDTLYAGMIATASEAVQMLPQETQLDNFERFRNYPCTIELRKEVTSAVGRATAFQRLYQTSRILAGSINSGEWVTSESLLRDLNTSEQFSEFLVVDRHKKTLVGRFEDEIFARVLAASKQRAEGFAAKNQTVLANVQRLYADTSFMPVYTLTYSASGQAEATRKRQQIQKELDQIKYYRFPDGAIRTLYRSLTENMSDRGVEKARAIVEHGKFYRGDDTQVKAYVDECDVSVAKAIVRPRDYRRVLALPVSDSKGGTNEYMFRLLLQIPSDAQFPVFDVNIKLPKEVAQNAGREQWYTSITINTTPIKNEGRFRITAPTSANGYESMVTPVQMDKAGKNILEVRFKYPGFRVFEVSAMAQVPIIRKN